MSNKTLFSGIKPSGDLTLGNYIGAIDLWMSLAHEFNSIFCIVDMHAITERQDPELLRKRTLVQLAQYIACGLNPKDNIIYIQSHLPQHAELSWILSTYTYMGELNRMTQYKDKISKGEKNINSGLFTYPVLMAADILLFDTAFVPVGDDQKQHVEIARDIAMRFNSLYGKTFEVPKNITRTEGKRIMSLQEPDKKMSKSDSNQNGTIYLLDDDKTIEKKIKRAVTDSYSTIEYSEDRKAVRNLIEIFSSLASEPCDDIAKKYSDKGYGTFKSDLANLVTSRISPVREKIKELLKDKTYLEDVYREGARKASEIADKTLDRVKEKIGFVKK